MSHLKMSWAAATIASKRYLALARVTAASFREHHPDVPFYLLLADEPAPGLPAPDEPFEGIPFEAVPLRERERLTFQYSELELSYALTPNLIEHLFDRGADRVIFLKQETLVLGSLRPEFELLDCYSALLTPHLLKPAQQGEDPQTELNVLRAGLYNGGFLGFSRREETLRFLGWWKEQTARECYRDVERGVHFEQRWLDFAPAFLPRCHILRNPEINIGHWNVLDRQDAVPSCRVFRFSGYQPEQPEMLTKYNLHLRTSQTGPAEPVIREYHRRLLEAGHWEAQQAAYAYGAYTDGVPISDMARRIHNDLGEDAARFGSPFSPGPGSFREWLQQPAGEGFPRSVTRFWKHVLNHRPDLQRIFDRAAGRTRVFYPHWIRWYGVKEYGKGDQ